VRFFYIYIKREREREVRQRRNEERYSRARFDLFFFSDFIAPGQWNFLVKGRKTNRKEREKFCRRVESVFTNAKRPKIDRGWKTERSNRAHFWFTVEVVVRKTAVSSFTRARDFFFFFVLPLFFLRLSLWFKSLTTISLSLPRLLHSHYIKNERAIIARPSVAQWSYRSNEEEFVCVKYTSFVFSSVNVEDSFARCAGKRPPRASQRERTLRFCKIYLSKACAESVLSIILSNFFSRSDVDIRLKIFFSFSLPFARASSLVKHLC